MKKKIRRCPGKLNLLVRFLVGMILALILDIPLRLADLCDGFAQWVYKYYGSEPLTEQLWKRRFWKKKPNVRCEPPREG